MTAALLQDIGKQLLAQTPAAIAKATRREKKSPVWCCALVFDSTDAQSALLPPELAISTVSERDRMLRKGGSGWNAPAFDGFGAAYYESAKLEDACERANELLLEGQSVKRVADLVVTVAKKLNALPRARFGAVAEEFVVYAFDRDQPAAALVTRCITAAQRARLKRLGLLEG